MGSLRHSHLISPNHLHLSFLLTLLLFFFHTTSGSERWVGGGAGADRKSGTLIGPGSWPPACRFRCGRCWPCEPVHVPIQPGLILPLEYYPEAWRCRCGNTLFNP